MARPELTVVMPFAGDRAQARDAIAALRGLDTRPGDALVLADNSGLVPPADGVLVIPAGGERSPARARNAGAEVAATEWVLFLDADCRACEGLLDAYFAQAPDACVGALAGEVLPAPGASTLAARYAGARNFLRQDAHLSHAYRPRAVAANLLVRRTAFEQVGGFYEGLRAAEDTDFCWRLQTAGWRLEIRPGARVEHRYRSSLGELRRQWRGYAAGRAWLARRYEDFEPEPAVARAARRAARIGRGGAPATGGRRGGRGGRGGRGASTVTPGRAERARYLTLDALLGVEELRGLTLSNRPIRSNPGPAHVVLVAERFPGQDDPLVDFVRSLDGARVEATARPRSPDRIAGRQVRIDYREDDGTCARTVALLTLLARHPARTLAEMLRGGETTSVLALAPAALRLTRDKRARVLALGGAPAPATAQRLTRLAGRTLGPSPGL